jgi:hypothetical protein
MTEQEWLTCSEPGPMVHHLRDHGAMYRTRWQGWVAARHWRTSERKLRLFACACCRRVAARMAGPEALAVIEAAEAHADGRCDLAAVERALAVVDRAEQARARVLEARSGPPMENSRCAFAALSCLAAADLERVVTVVHFASLALQRSVIHTTDKGSFEGPAQACLLREIVGNPFVPPRIDPAWLSWNEGIVEHMARTIHQDRAYQDMPILADALADAGCRDETILGHCRDEGTVHAMGCWVLDLLTGRE